MAATKRRSKFSTMPDPAPSPAARKPLSLGQRAILLGLAAAVVATLLQWLPYVESLELSTLDIRFRQRNGAGISPNILFISIGDYDLQKHGQWQTWSRDLQARMLAAFTNSVPAPKAIGYDIIFSSPMADSAPARVEKPLPSKGGKPSPSKAKEPVTTYQEDARFGKILEQLANVCLPGAVRRTSAVTDVRSELDSASLRWLQQQLIPPIEDSQVFTPPAEVVIPAPAFCKETHFGLLNTDRDADGIVRRVPMLIRQGDHWLPSLAFRVAMLYYDLHADDITVRRGREIRIKSPDVDFHIPVTEDKNGNQQLLINYRGKLTDFCSLPFQVVLDTLNPKIEKDQRVRDSLQNAHRGVVVVGLTATSWDVGPTPVDPAAPLVTVQINAINNLIQKDFLRKTPGIITFLLTLLLSTGIAQSTLRYSAGKGAVVFIATLVAFTGLVILQFTKMTISLWIPFVVPSTGIILAYTGGTALRFTGEERQKRELRRAFQNYLSANIMEEVLKNPASMQLGGDLKEITVLFTDVRGFTSFCEKNREDPKKVVSVLNEVLAVVSEIVIEHDGTLDKYIGDAVMAFWGAPTPGKKPHAQQAVEAAFEMRKTLAQRRKEWEARGLPVLHLGVGINTGSMVVGNIGSSRLRNYTVIGHEVNMGARLEAETRKFDTDIILSQATVDRLGPNFKTRYLSEVHVKGAEQPIKIYALDDITQP